MLDREVPHVHTTFPAAKLTQKWRLAARDSTVYIARIVNGFRVDIRAFRSSTALDDWPARSDCGNIYRA